MNELQEILEAYRRGERGLPTYDELQRIASPSQPSSVAMTDDEAIYHIPRAALDEFNEKFCNRDSALMACAESAFFACTRALLQSSPKGASTGTERDALAGLVLAMREWGHQEDGIPDFACAAFNKAMVLLQWEYGDDVSLQALHHSLSSPQEASKPQDEREAFDKWSVDYDYRVCSPWEVWKAAIAWKSSVASPVAVSEDAALMVERLRAMRLGPCNDAANMIEVLARALISSKFGDNVQDDAKDGA